VIGDRFANLTGKDSWSMYDTPKIKSPLLIKNTDNLFNDGFLESKFNYHGGIVQNTLKADDINILILLDQQKENFPAMYNYIKSKNITPSTIFLPQILKQIDSEFSLHQELLFESLSYLDIVNTYSLVVYSDSFFFIENMKKIIVNNRTVINHNNCIAKDAIDDFIFNKKEEALEFIENNKTILSLYIFSVVFLIFYTADA